MNNLESSVRFVKRSVICFLDCGKVNDSLRMIHDFVERIITEPLCTAQVFSSNDLDKLCLEIGLRNNEDILTSCKSFTLNINFRGCVVYIVSRLQRSGGHSRLVQDFIREQPTKRHLILSTEIGGPSDYEYLESTLSQSDNVQIMYAPKGSFQARLSWIQSILHECDPQRVHLFNHHQDSVAVAAVASNSSLTGYFYHHGDHHLCLGVHLANLTHVDLHPMGYHYCRDELGINNHYLPLTFKDRGLRPYSGSFMSGGGLTTATAARSNKVEIPYYVSYLDLVPKLLTVTKGRHIHIGRLTPLALRRIRKQMNDAGLNKDQFVYIEWTQSVWETLVLEGVDVYLASFPYGAGLTLVEVMGAGIPAIMHQHIFSRVLSGLELAYPEAFCWSDPESLLAHLTNLKPEQIKHEKVLARNCYERFHCPEILNNFLNSVEPPKLEIPSLRKDFKPRLDEWAAWAESQLCFSRLAYRFLYRAFRKIRLAFN